MPNIHQPLPSGETETDVFARELARLIGPGYQPADGTLIAEDLRALGSLLARARAHQTSAILERFAHRATETLPEWEKALELPVDPTRTLEQRRAAVVAKIRAIFGGTPQRILKAVRALAPEATLVENRAVDVLADPRQVFRWVVLISAAHFGDEATRGRIADLIEQMEPAITGAGIATRVGFRFDDPDSLFDRDVFGS
jgi:uncharacterized protein YmfQ (DUF2313 family)